MKSNDIYSIHEQLLAAAAGDIPFAAALEKITTAFGGAGGVVFELNRKTGAFANWVGPGLEAGRDEYMDHLNSINPRMAYSLRHATGRVVYEAMLIDDRAIEKHEFYNWLDQTHGFRYFLGSRVYDDGDLSLFHSVEFTTKHGHPDAEKIEAFKRLAPAVGNAWRLANRHAPGPAVAGTGVWVPDHLPWAIFALSGNGEVIDMNRAARVLLDRADLLGLEDRRVVALDSRSSEDFGRIIASGMAGKTAETLLQGSTAMPLVAQVVPVNPGRIAAPTSVAAVVYVWKPQQFSDAWGQTLERLFRFTKAEYRLACVMAGGADLNLAAEQLGISRNTARNQLQSMFAKTGTHRQNEFLVQILGVLQT